MAQGVSLPTQMFKEIPCAIYFIFCYALFMKTELDTLFLPYTDGTLEFPDEATKTLFVNGHEYKTLQRFSAGNTDILQFFRPYAKALEEFGYSVIHDAEQIKQAHYDTVLLLATKNQRETENLLARSFMALRDNGFLVMVADNKSGGTRLKKMFEKLGFSNIAEAAKNKARVVWAQKTAVNKVFLEQCLSLDRPREIAEGLRSRLGLYGWDKIDKGSQILVSHLPADLKGKGADFGCGYGYLSRAVLAKNKKIKALDYIDADFRALEMCAHNTQGFELEKRGFWLDLTNETPELRPYYDWIVMNPPFHEGKKTDSDIGAAFIKKASRYLRKKGQLWMVANNHLPYERVLESCFFNFRSIDQGQGFKVFCAYK